MSQNGKDIRITDLRNPILTETQRRVLGGAEDDPVTLDAGLVLDNSRKATGLDDFGSEDFVPRLREWFMLLRDDPNRTAFSRAQELDRCTRAAIARLRLQKILLRHPEIHKIRIRKPIIIVGPGRSGTTHMHGLLAADSSLRSVRIGEFNTFMNPLAVSIDLMKSNTALWSNIVGLLPHFTIMHPMAPGDPLEDHFLQAPDFPVGLWELTGPVPHDSRYLECDQTRHYEYMKIMLKVLQWRRGPDRWVLKSPFHSEQLGPLLSTFPDAIIVMTHRDPLAVLQSQVTMNVYASRLTHHKVDVEAALTRWADRIEAMLKAAIRDRHLVPTGRLLDVTFDEFMTDKSGVVRKIYSAAEMKLTTDRWAMMRQFLTLDDRRRSERISYNLRRDYGIDPLHLRTRYQFYYDRFPVRAEVH